MGGEAGVRHHAVGLFAASPGGLPNRSRHVAHPGRGARSLTGWLNGDGGAETAPAAQQAGGTPSPILTVARVAAGNFLEMYDFMVFGYFAAAIGRAYFPAGRESASLMLAFATYGAAFLMRPVGAVVLGSYVDRRGRRAGLLLTLGLMSAGTLSIA